MITDVAAIALALLAILVAARPSSAERTFGYQRTEVLAALVNAMSLWLIAAWVVFEAYHRLQNVPDVEGRLMLVVGVIGLGVNVAAAMVLHGSSGHSLNVEGAFWHVIADLMGSVVVVISAIVITTLGWSIIDPILSVVIAVLIVASSSRLVFKVINVLLEGVPEHIDVLRLCSELEEEQGVTLVHDVHVWSISSGYDSFTAHVLVDPSYQGSTDALLNRMRDIAKRKFDIDHITIQLEGSAAGCTENHHVDHRRNKMRTQRKKRFALPFF